MTSIVNSFCIKLVYPEISLRTLRVLNNVKPLFFVSSSKLKVKKNPTIVSYSKRLQKNACYDWSFFGWYGSRHSSFALVIDLPRRPRADATFKCTLQSLQTLIYEESLPSIASALVYLHLQREHPWVTNPHNWSCPRISLNYQLPLNWRHP